MPLRRFQQIAAAIQQRHYQQRIEKQQLIEWQTKNLASMIAATAPVDQKGHNSLMNMVNGMSFFPVEDDSGSKTGSENAPGSYEKLMAGFGAPPR